MTPEPVPANKISLDIPVLIDGRKMSALVDTGADYSILSGKLASVLKKVTLPWNGAPVRTAGGHVVTPLGLCTARVEIRGAAFLATCLVLRECSRDLILGMDFLREYGAIIDLRERCITFSTKRATAQTDVIGRRSALRVSDDSITIPPRASVMVSVKSDELENGEAIVEGNISMLLTQGICVARSLVELRDSQTAVLVTNFTFEHRHIFRGTAVAYAEPSTDIVECFASEVDTDDSSLRDIDVNSELMDDEKSALQEL